MERIGLSLVLLLVLEIVGFILDVVSFSIPYWNWFETGETWGLWQRCLESHGCAEFPERIFSDTMLAGRSLLAIGLASYVIQLIVLGVYVFYRDVIVLTVAIVNNLITVIPIFLGTVLWASTTNTSLYWCYYLSYIAGLVVTGNGVVLTYIRRQTLITQHVKSGAV